MSDSSYTKFFDLLSSVSETETFKLTTTNQKDYTFKQLTTAQLKQLIKTVVDTPLTQTVFNTTLASIMAESIVDQGINIYSFNIVDRLLFCLQTRIESISPTFTHTKTKNPTAINLQTIKNSLVEKIKANPNAFASQTFTNSSISVSYGIPTLQVEKQLNDEIYKGQDINIQTEDDLRKVLGETFINEIAKTLQAVTVNETVLYLDSLTFAERLKVIENIPASITNNIVEYIENYKKILESSLLVENEITVPIDGSLFSLR
jgi:uncharacterized membrane-anchored protein YjiN (DUF445 family)